MELFKLLGRIAIENDGAKKSIDDTADKAKDLDSKMSKAFTNIGNAAVKIGKVMVSGLAVGSAAIAGLTKSALDAYADYEQLKGGVETLFGAGGKTLKEYAESVGKSVDDVKTEYDSLMKAQETVLKNASGAYESAGMSMNEYMETVTGFSASLIQSLGGDTEAAAKKAHQAITDMSDNANKMGTSMTLIQNAYGGFAKGNYTMLDNLKLGYSGTQEEMKRLIQDASKMKDVQEELGVTVDANSMSFGNIVDAITVVQKSMGILGTTSNEAAGTISGSIGMMKSAWKNLVAGFGDDNANFSVLIDNFVNSISTVGKNVIPRVEKIVDGIANLIVQLAPKISAMLPGVLDSLLPALVTGAVALIDGLVQSMPSIISALTKALPAIIDGIVQITIKLVGFLPQFVNVLSSALPTIIPQLITAIIEIIPALAIAIVECLPPLAISIAEGFVNALRDNGAGGILDLFTELGGKIRSSYETYIAPSVASIATSVNGLWGTIVSAYEVHIKPTIDAFIGMIQTLWTENQDKITLIQELFSAASQWISEKITSVISFLQEYVIPYILIFVQAIQENMMYIQEYIQAGIDFISAIIQFFIDLFQGNWSAMWENVKNILNLGAEFIKKCFQMMINVVKSLVVGWIQFILDKVFGLQIDLEQKFTEIKDSIVEKWNNIKASVSEAVANLKENVTQTFTELKEALKVPINGIIDMVNKVIDALNSLSWDFPDWIPGFGGKSFSFNLKRVEYLAEGGILTSPTLLQYNPYAGTATVAGEAGAEAVIPIEKLRVWIAEEMAAQNYGVVKVLQSILDAILALDENMGGNLRDALSGTAFKVNNREFGRLVKAVK